MNQSVQSLPAFRVACSGRSHVLITGPTGSGKSRLARRIHDAGARRERPFVVVNLACLHEGTLESELFGHERGAFTGADSKRVGKLELAQGGTVFLDEIGELTPRLQARLLEFLHSGMIRPLGARAEIRLDVRVICATHRDLPKMVASGEFREDLFHRIRVATIALPSLRELAADFDGILHDCLADVSREQGRPILRVSEDFAQSMERYGWPGNFRELRNVLEYAVQVAEAGILRVKDLPADFQARVSRVAAADSPIGVAEERVVRRYEAAIRQFERNYLDTALRRNSGKVNQTARDIGMNKTTLIQRIRKYALAGESRQDF